MNRFFSLCLLCGWLAGLATLLPAQQMPYSQLQLLHTSPFNPGMFPRGNMNELQVLVQQRALVHNRLASGTQFLQFNHKPIGKKETFTWGVQMIHDVEHTERRLSVSPQIAARLMKKGGSSLSVGISVGLLAWNSDYLHREIFELGDPELTLNSNQTLKVLGGIGLVYQFQNNVFDIAVGGALNQLGADILDQDSLLIPVLPHLNLQGHLLYRFSPEISAGPRVFYRNIVGQDEIRQRVGTTDIGLQVMFDQKQFWAAAGYRMGNSALSTGLGFRLLRTDTAQAKDLFGSFVDFNLGFAYPMNGASLFGPTAEVGLKWTFGRKKIEIEIFERPAENFWKSDDLMTKHRVKWIDPNAPNGLEAKSDFNNKAVYLDYTFPDDDPRYVGDAPVVRHDSLLYRIGMEWIGVDALLENIPEYAVKEGLWPDSVGVIDKENLEYLETLAEVELSADLWGDEERVHFNSGVVYDGELGTNNWQNDTLFIDVVFNDADTTVAIRQGAYVSELELAALKLHAMRKKLEYELLAQFNNHYVVNWEGEAEDSLEIRPAITIKKLRIVPNHPQLDCLQENNIHLKFTRNRKYIKVIESLQEDRDEFPSEEEEKMEGEGDGK